MRTHFWRWMIILPLWVAACAPIGNTAERNSDLGTAIPKAQGDYRPSAAVVLTERLHFDRIGLEDGLSQSSVMAMLQDKQGFMWFGTEDGLNRFDGQNFKTFRPVQGDPASLSDGWVCSLGLDPNGDIWVGTRLGGLNRYNSRTGLFTRYQHDPQEKNSLSNNNVHVIFFDAQGTLWVGTDAGLDLFNAESGTFEHFQLPEGESLPVFSVVSEKDGTFWLGTTEGLWQFDPKQGAILASPVGKGVGTVRWILGYPDGSLWLAASKGLVHFLPAQGDWQWITSEDGLSFDDVRSLLLDPSGMIWVGTVYGLNLLDPTTSKFVQFIHQTKNVNSISANFVHSLFLSQDQILWVGTYGGGLSFYDPLANKFEHFSSDPEKLNGLSNNLVFSVSPGADGAIWLATYGSGLDRFDPDSATFTNFRHDSNDLDSLRSDYLWSVLAARDGSVWVGTVEGLDRLDPVSGKFVHYPHDSQRSGDLPGAAIYNVYEDRQGNIWVGTNHGLAKYDSGSQRFIRYLETGDETGLLEGSVTDIVQTRDGMIWVATFSGGVSQLDPATGVFKHYISDPRVSGKLSNNSVLALHEDSAGVLWLGTAGGGLNRYNPEEDSFTAFTDRDGLPNNVVYGILEDQIGQLWLSTNLGIARFHPATGTTTNYTTADGLQSNEFNMGAFAKDLDGRMYFGGVNGLNVFKPEEVVANSFVPLLGLVSVTQNGKAVSVETPPEMLKEITLRYPDNSFEFEFAALSYSQVDKNHYAYMLEGVDGDWFFAGSNRGGRYANLPGGTYILRMKAANADGVWNEEGISLQVTVIPPFWQRWWFYTLCVLALLIGIVGVYRLRVHDMALQKQELERLVGERTKQIEQLFEQTKELAILEERNRLARDLHDSAKQKAFAALAQLGAARSLGNDTAGKGALHLQEAEVLVSEVIQEITFLIQEIHPAALKEKGLSAVLREYAFEWGNRTGIAVDLSLNGDGRLPLEIEQALYRAIQEALANVARHSNARAVQLSLVIQPEEVNISVVDDGQGFDPSQTPRGMGLRSINERVERFGGRFTLESNPGDGTRLVITIPIKDPA
ncbi:MAG: hypothetical protein JW987_05475 [Anaerolineaceae bacterium]|nr:hypothetical protein [Anaerolineaceae bacterium]